MTWLDKIGHVDRVQHRLGQMQMRRFWFFSPWCPSDRVQHRPGPDWYFLSITFSVLQLLWHKKREISWMHASRLIGFLLEREFNHVKREKCKKKILIKTLLVLFQRTWRMKLFAKTGERKLKFVFVLALFFWIWLYHRQIFDTATPNISNYSRWMYKDPAGFSSLRFVALTMK